MRTAEEIFNGIAGHSSGTFHPLTKELILNMINEARKEAIEECAERATVTLVGRYTVGKLIASSKEVQVAVNKQSILLLINELK